MSQAFRDIIGSMTDEEALIFFFMPGFLCRIVAGADGVLDRAEQQAVNRSAIKANEIDDEWSAVAAHFEDDVATMRSHLQDEFKIDQDAKVRRFHDLIDSYKSILDRLPDDLHHHINDHIVDSMISVADASGGTFLGFGNRIDQTERNNIKIILRKLQINIRDNTKRSKLGQL